MEQHNSENWHLIIRYLKGDISQLERAGLLSWVNETSQNQIIFEQVKNLWELTSGVSEEFEPDVDADWEVLKLKIRREDVPFEKKVPFKIINIFNTTVLVKIAAVVIILLCFGYLSSIYLNREKNVEYVTSLGEEKQVVLPDSSKVLLKENSRLSFSENFNKNDRIVYFRGNAFFDIKKTMGKKFSVYSGDAITEVLGTTFYVRSYLAEHQVTVTLLTGKVAFWSKKDIKKKIYLSPGESVYLKNNRIVHKKKAIVHEKKAKVEKEGNMEFNDMRLEEVFQKLEAYYDIEIETSSKAINDCKFTGTFLKCNSSKILKVLTVSLNLSFKNNGNKYLISGSGCK